MEDVAEPEPGAPLCQRKYTVDGLNPPPDFATSPESCQNGFLSNPQKLKSKDRFERRAEVTLNPVSIHCVGELTVLELEG